VLNAIGDAVIEDVSFSDVRVTYAGGGTAEEAAREIPQVVGEYFEIGTPPAYGLYARDVRGLSLSNVRFDVESPDLRPAVVFDHVADATLNGVSVAGNRQAKAAMRMVESRDVLVAASRVTSATAAAVMVEGAGSAGIVVDGGDWSRAAEAVVFGSGAVRGSVTVR